MGVVRGIISTAYTTTNVATRDEVSTANVAAVYWLYQLDLIG